MTKTSKSTSPIEPTIYPGLMSKRRYETTPASLCYMGNKVDAAIFPFLKSLNSRHWLVTTSSCSGHGAENPYVSVAIKVSAIKKFVRLLNALTGHLDGLGFLVDCGLDYDPLCATACDFKNFPEWLMFELSFHRIGNALLLTDAKFWHGLTDALNGGPK